MIACAGIAARAGPRPDAIAAAPPAALAGDGASEPLRVRSEMFYEALAFALRRAPDAAGRNGPDALQNQDSSRRPGWANR